MWYRLSHIRGEYWLTEDGHLYADGRYSDDNHEMLAESHILNQLGNDINDETWGTQTLYNARNMFYDAIGNPRGYYGQMEDYVEALQEQYGDDWPDYADFTNYLVWLNTHQIQDENTKRAKEEWVEREIEGTKDSRTHVSKYYDWVRVENNNIEVWELNDLSRERIKEQIENIYDEENEEGDDFYNDESWKYLPIFNLSILSTGKYTPKLTFYDLVTPGLDKKKERENAFEPFPDWNTQRRPNPVPMYKYDGG